MPSRSTRVATAIATVSAVRPRFVCGPRVRVLANASASASSFHSRSAVDFSVYFAGRSTERPSGSQRLAFPAGRQCQKLGARHDGGQTDLELRVVRDVPVEGLGDLLAGEHRLAVAQQAQQLLGVGADQLGIDRLGLGTDRQHVGDDKAPLQPVPGRAFLRLGTRSMPRSR